MNDTHACISCGKPTQPEDYLNVEVYTPKDEYISIVPLCADCLHLFGWQDAIAPWLAWVRQQDRADAHAVPTNSSPLGTRSEQSEGSDDAD